MTRPFRLLGAANSSATTEPPPEQAATVDSDFVVILAALLCALICVLGLIAVARCAWLRRLSGAFAPNPSASSRPPPPANKGLKKKILKSLPKATFSPDFSAKFSDCAICLTEFAAGDEIRVLPQCGHGFHVVCIDTWLGSHSSCPSCRQILVARCQKCGGLPGPGASTSGTNTEARLKEREDDVNRFLP
ncbi:hypothetical protein ERO13_A01G102500v2 [Gossypium hirsutum]|uniref:RING-type domain-containing protein n=5 Tax=Gossypium TaxID=3633 RepID=A0ABR0R1M1_GOSAR|nr:RING-H2 finger protein ATL80-like [Gossypium hirsutum]XP_017640724.1 RING-H2 finger protein ATL80 [Gossypium arboreum]TYH30665.1 hypothetical protein ES288_A01G113200v1 [Gossypium darwinii]TYI42754.1 hypothetical protein ES332_A01G120900v1 [Gossypium tomentosum]TYJ49038.1 hypothetical protein E1A91_A01G106900v1 [Gossypium mustelinum]KAG4214132.1 hypothetical protein ERO13_A01G102500v2 [Gossypium hirsutum]KAK5845057.1 hypothetical protein PVK06_001210 [Gossypium arboreum]